MHYITVWLLLSLAMIAACTVVPPEPNTSRPDQRLQGRYFDQCEPRTETPAKLIAGRTPLYPVNRYLAEEDGHTDVAFDITALGRVENLTRIGSSHPSFYVSTREAIAEWQFAPAEQDGVAITVHCEFRQSFSVPHKWNRRP